jgi:hypothetical protein
LSVMGASLSEASRSFTPVVSVSTAGSPASPLGSVEGCGWES